MPVVHLWFRFILWKRLRAAVYGIQLPLYQLEFLAYQYYFAEYFSISAPLPDTKFDMVV